MDTPAADAFELTVLIPTLNEGTHLAGLLAGVKEAVAQLTLSFEFLIVDGGSRDDTAAQARTFGARVERQKGRGFGAAIREGLELARGRWVLAMDADGSHPTRFFQELWARRQNSDLVIASRFVSGGGGDMPRHRYWLSWLLNTVTRHFLGLSIRDSSSGLRLYRRGAMQGLPLAAEDFSIQQEALVQLLARGGRAEEIPFFYEPRIGGESKADILLLARRYLRMLYQLKRVRCGRHG
ncbi:MAG: glycosyltransferase [Elusimicrobiota bacterium]|jgi:dolichol-phosphate mannosyltransferase